MNPSIHTEPIPNTDELFTVTLNSTTAITTTVTRSSSVVTAWLSALRSSSSPTTIVGLDIEWRPNNANHENPVSLLQLCVGNTCLLFQLLHADSIPSSLISFLKDPNYKFLGVGIRGDVEKLIYDYDLGVRNKVDLRDLAKERMGREEMKQMGIKKLAMEVLGIEINKPKRISMSRWDSEWLMLDQIGYATIDAYLSFEIGRRLYATSSASTAVSTREEMADAYLGYRPRFQQPAAAAPNSGAVIPPLKSRHPDYGAAPVGSGQRVIYPGEQAITSVSSIADTEAIGINASYDQYLRNGMGTFGSMNPAHGLTGALPVRPVDDSRALGIGVMDSRSGAYSGVRRSEAPLPPPLPQDATNTLFVEGLPADCSRREVSHIFRPFIGFREVRLVTKESKHRGGEKFLLCFVDFANAGQASAALDALQGYKFDEHEHDPERLRIQFSRSPGPKSGGGPRGRR